MQERWRCGRFLHGVSPSLSRKFAPSELPERRDGASCGRIDRHRAIVPNNGRFLECSITVFRAYQISHLERHRQDLFRSCVVSGQRFQAGNYRSEPGKRYGFYTRRNLENIQNSVFRFPPPHVEKRNSPESRKVNIFRIYTCISTVTLERIDLLHHCVATFTHSLHGKLRGPRITDLSVLYALRLEQVGVQWEGINLLVRCLR